MGSDLGMGKWEEMTGTKIARAAPMPTNPAQDFRGGFQRTAVQNGLWYTRVTTRYMKVKTMAYESSCAGMMTSASRVRSPSDFQWLVTLAATASADAPKRDRVASAITAMRSTSQPFQTGFSSAALSRAAGNTLSAGSRSGGRSRGTSGGGL